MGEAVLGHDLVALGALAAAGAAQHPHDGEAGGGEGGAVHRLQYIRCGATVMTFMTRYNIAGHEM